jgi:phage terminase large subunit-like protein
MAMDAISLIATVTQLMGPITDLYQQQKKADTRIKPSAAVVRQYEDAVYTFRDQRVSGGVKGIVQILLDSVEAFEGGRVLDAGRAVMMAIEQCEAAGNDLEITITPDELATLQRYRTQLFKLVVPSPELKQKRMDL